MAPPLLQLQTSEGREGKDGSAGLTPDLAAGPSLDLWNLQIREGKGAAIDKGPGSSTQFRKWGWGWGGKLFLIWLSNGLHLLS